MLYRQRHAAMIAIHICGMRFTVMELLDLVAIKMAVFWEPRVFKSNLDWTKNI